MTQGPWAERTPDLSQEPADVTATDAPAGGSAAPAGGSAVPTGGSAAPSELLRIATAGSVDDGKSTLIGRLLYDSKAIFEDQMAAIERASQRRGDSAVDLALLTDGLRAEREQGITIDVAYRYFATPQRKFVIADTPGHVQYTRNMVTGASTAELAIVLIDARKGVLTQSRRHGYIAALLQIPHILVAVNKMDLVDYDQAVFDAIVAEYSAFARELAIKSLAFIPISALNGDNVVHDSDHMPWYTGPNLIDFLNRVDVSGHRQRNEFRFPVQLAVRPHQDFRGFAGQVASGTVASGDAVTILPSGRQSVVRSIVAGGEEVLSASQGDSVILVLADEIDVSRGDMLVHASTQPQVDDDLECVVCWLGTEPLDLSRSYLLLHTTHEVQAQVSEVYFRVDVDTLRQDEAKALGLNEIGHVRIRTSQPLFFDPYTDNRATGSFILVDPYSHNTVAAGMIRGAVARSRAETAPAHRRVEGRSRSANVVWEEGAITREARETRNGHQAAVLWFTGLSGAGKSTVARLLEQRLFTQGVQTFFLDGDNVRHGLNGDLGFSAADRKENIRRVAEVARLAFDHGQLALCTFISPYREDRELARRLLPEGRFLEIHVKCDLQECIRRDPKGLYQRALAGELRDFTGVSSPYEEPLAPDLVVQTDARTPEECADQILRELRRRGILPAHEVGA